MSSRHRDAVRVVDVGRGGQDRRDQRQHLSSGQRATDTSTEADRLVHECFETEAHHERRRDDESGCSDQGRLVEGHCNPLERAR